SLRSLWPLRFVRPETQAEWAWLPQLSGACGPPLSRDSSGRAATSDELSVGRLLLLLLLRLGLSRRLLAFRRFGFARGFLLVVEAEAKAEEPIPYVRVRLKLLLGQGCRHSLPLFEFPE